MPPFLAFAVTSLVLVSVCKQFASEAAQSLPCQCSGLAVDSTSSLRVTTLAESYEKLRSLTHLTRWHSWRASENSCNVVQLKVQHSVHDTSIYFMILQYTSWYFMYSYHSPSQNQALCFRSLRRLSGAPNFPRPYEVPCLLHGFPDRTWPQDVDKGGSESKAHCSTTDQLLINSNSIHQIPIANLEF